MKIVETIYCESGSTAKEIGVFYNRKGYVIFQSTINIEALGHKRKVKRMQIVKKKEWD